MATRRTVQVEQTVPDKDENQSSSTAPVVPRSVITKLLMFTFAMIIAPLGSYFLTVRTIFAGNNTYAGATAAIVANIVLITYVLVAVAEDKEDQESKKKR